MTVLPTSAGTVAHDSRGSGDPVAPPLSLPDALEQEQS
jgi:hypothetical protein